MYMYKVRTETIDLTNDLSSVLCVDNLNFMSQFLKCKFCVPNQDLTRTPTSRGMGIIPGPISVILIYLNQNNRSLLCTSYKHVLDSHHHTSLSSQMALPLLPTIGMQVRFLGQEYSNSIHLSSELHDCLLDQFLPSMIKFSLEQSNLIPSLSLGISKHSGRSSNQRISSNLKSGFP